MLSFVHIPYVCALEMFICLLCIVVWLFRCAIALSFVCFTLMVFMLFKI